MSAKRVYNYALLIELICCSPARVLQQDMKMCFHTKCVIYVHAGSTTWLTSGPGNTTVESLHLGANIKTIEWAPQNDILGHPGVGAFLTQGGINSLYEAAYHAKPLVTIPLVADQEGNAVKVFST